MKLNFAFALLFFSVSVTILSAQQDCAPVNNISLFNGKDLSGWEFFLRDQAIDPSSVFMVKDAAIHISGNPSGYMRTSQQYNDYKLHLEWRWAFDASNSGILIHMQKPDTIWPTCYETQVMAGNTGDIVCVGNADLNERTDKSVRVKTKLSPSNEVSAGDWNTVEIICKGNSIEVYVNGQLQNKATGLNFSKGSICLQSNGKAVEFRNIFLVKI